MHQFTAIISGRVQLVMFRDFTQRTASRLGIVGTVENCSDGTVKVVAQGKKEVLKRLVAKLKKGSLLAKVDRIAVEWQNPIETFSDFRIVYY